MAKDNKSQQTRSGSHGTMQVLDAITGEDVTEQTKGPPAADLPPLQFRANVDVMSREEILSQLRAYEGILNALVDRFGGRLP